MVFILYVFYKSDTLWWNAKVKDGNVLYTTDPGQDTMSLPGVVNRMYFVGTNATTIWSYFDNED